VTAPRADRRERKVAVEVDGGTHGTGKRKLELRRKDRNGAITIACVQHFLHALRNRVQGSLNLRSRTEPLTSQTEFVRFAVV
jgi:hypothetical protein